MSLERLTKQFKKEHGVTLVELLAAIAILSIIVTAFLAYFTQAGRTNNVTTEINEATFVAQEEMELVTYLSQNNYTIEQVRNHYGNVLKEEGYSVTEKDNIITIKKLDGYSIIIELFKSNITGKDEFKTELYHAVVKVLEGGSTRAAMETVVPFSKANNPEK